MGRRRRRNPGSATMDDIVPSAKRWDGQFVVTDRGDPGPACFGRTVTVGAIAVHMDQRLRMVSVIDPNGRLIGVFLGQPVDYESRRLLTEDTPIVAPVDESSPGSATSVEELIYGFGGRWAFVYSSGDSSRIYLDAGGGNGVVYDPERRRAASTTGLLLSDEEYVARFDGDLYRTLRITQDGWFPAGLTAHVGIRRLLCNHYLDLERWRCSRHWPTDDVRWTSDPHGHSVRITDIATATTETLLANGKVVAALTAGNESRLLLAAMRPIAGDVEFVTNGAPGTELDVHHAQFLSQRFGLRHRVLRPRAATDDEMRSWQYEIGHCIGGNNMRYHPSIAPLRNFDYFVGGVAGEVGRGFFWRASDDEATELDPRGVAMRLGMPMHQRVVDAVADWLVSVEGMNPLTQLDLAYLELRVSAWAFAQGYAQDRIVSHMHPLITRESFRLMLELDPVTKRSNGYVTSGVRARWPELLEIPINKYGDRRDVLSLARKVSQPKRVARKLRRLVR